MSSSQWQKLKFADVAILKRDSVNASEIGDDDVYVGLEHIAPDALRLDRVGRGADVSSGKLRFQPGDILFGKLRPYFRKVFYSTFSGVCSTDIWVLTAREGVDPRFLFYCTANQSFVDYANSGASGTRMPRANWNHASAYPVFLPPIDEQRAIAEVLGALDERIEWCEALIRVGRECQDALFGTLINHADVVRLGDWAHFDKGVSYKGDHVTSDSSDRPLLNLGLFARESRVRWENLKYYSGVVKERHAVHAGDVVVCATDMTQDRAVLGRIAVVPMWLQGAAITHHLYALRVRDDAPFPAWVAGLAIAHEPNRRRLAATANGTTVLALPKDIVEAIEVPVPATSDMGAFDDVFWALQGLIEALESERAGLAALHGALLPRLISGEVRIPDPQALLESVE
jgi:type I restriction enzyme S subunit